MQLSDYLDASFRRPWNDETHNCALFIADWVWLRTGRDPAADLRGLFRTEADWRAILEREGGLGAVVARRAEAHGLARTASAAAGDIGLPVVPALDAAGRPEPAVTCAIRTGSGKWAMVTARGLVVLRAETTVAAWTVP